MCGYVDDLNGLTRGRSLFDGTFHALAAHLVRIPAVVADKLEALVRNMLRDGRDEVAGGEDLEVALSLRVHGRAAHARPAGRVDLHRFDGEEVPDDVLGQALQVFALVGQHASAAMYVEAGMHPAAQHLSAGRRQKVLVHEECDDPRPEQLLQRLEAYIGQDVGQP